MLKMFLVSPEQLETMKKIASVNKEKTGNNNIKRKQTRKRKSKPSTRHGHKDSSKDRTAHNKWLEVKKRKEEECILDKTVAKRIAQFLSKVMPTHMPPTPISVKHEIPVADVIKKEPASLLLIKKKKLSTNRHQPVVAKVKLMNKRPWITRPDISAKSQFPTLRDMFTMMMNFWTHNTESEELMTST
jgi:hypothetical protein